MTAEVDKVDKVEKVEEEGPVTMSIVRQVVPGREQDYETWVRGITAVALTFPGHMGVNVIRPTPPSREYVSIFRFDSYQHLCAWKKSPVREEWLSRLEGIVEGEDEVRRATGLEFWFNLPELPAAQPSPHKMALVLLLVVFTLVNLLNLLLAPLADIVHSQVRIFLGVFLQVMLMTYLVMPRVTRMLKSWLFA